MEWGSYEAPVTSKCLFLSKEYHKQFKSSRSFFSLRICQPELIQPVCQLLILVRVKVGIGVQCTPLEAVHACESCQPGAEGMDCEELAKTAFRNSFPLTQEKFEEWCRMRGRGVLAVYEIDLDANRMKAIRLSAAVPVLRPHQHGAGHGEPSGPDGL